MVMMMCWKQEWASAINNINWGIIHVKRAQIKLQKRALRNDKFLRYLSQNKHKSSPKMIAEVQKLLEKNRDGAFKSALAIATLRDIQAELKNMIKTYGISHTSKPARTRELMAGRRKVAGKVKRWVDKY